MAPANTLGCQAIVMGDVKRDNVFPNMPGQTVCCIHILLDAAAAA